MATIELYSTELGELADFDLEVDQNGEIVARRSDNDDSDTDEMIKFPAGLTKSEFQKLVKEHNQANEGIVARDPEELEEEEKAKERSEKLLEDL